MAYRIVTNNPLVFEAYSTGFAVDFVKGDAAEVFEAIENALVNGWKLLTTPLPPNVPLIRSAIRTVVLQSSPERYDVPGLHCLAQARERTETLAKAHRPSQRRDLEHIDWTFAQRAMLELSLAGQSGRAPAPRNNSLMQ